MLAEIDANGWVAIIGAVVVGIMQITQMILSALRQQTNRAVQSELKEKVTEIAHQGNAMKDALVKITGESERAKGVLEGVVKEKANSGNSGVKLV